MEGLEMGDGEDFGRYDGFDVIAEAYKEKKRKEKVVFSLSD